MTSKMVHKSKLKFWLMKTQNSYCIFGDIAIIRVKPHDKKTNTSYPSLTNLKKILCFQMMSTTTPWIKIKYKVKINQLWTAKDRIREAVVF